MKAVILAGGNNSRYNGTPKAMLEIAGKTLYQSTKEKLEKIKKVESDLSDVWFFKTGSFIFAIPMGPLVMPTKFFKRVSITIANPNVINAR